MPTRSFGDFRLKYGSFNSHPWSGTRGYRPPLAKYTGPYITHKPDIHIHSIQPNDHLLILASDGLWDELSVEEAAGVVDSAKENTQHVSEL